MPLWRDRQRPPYPEVTGVNCLVPSTQFPQAPWYTLPVHLCRFRVRAATALARGFSRQHGITLLRLNRLRITPHPRHPRQTPGFTWASGHELAPGQPPPGGTTLLRHPITCLLPDRVPRSPHNTSRRRRKRFGWSASPAWAWTHRHEHGNINPLSIDYACRPRLRSRLTQGGLAWPWNP